MAVLVRHMSVRSHQKHIPLLLLGIPAFDQDGASRLEAREYFAGRGAYGILVRLRTVQGQRWDLARVVWLSTINLLIGALIVHK